MPNFVWPPRQLYRLLKLTSTRQPPLGSQPEVPRTQSTPSLPSTPLSYALIALLPTSHCCAVTEPWGLLIAMFSVVNRVVHRAVSSVLWLATGMDGSVIWKSSRPLEAAKNTFAMIFQSSDSAISSSPPPTSPVITILPRPTFARASTSATLCHADIDFVSLDSLQKPSTGNQKSADRSGDRLSSESVTQVEDGNFDKGAPIAPSTAVRWRRGKKVSKNMARWMPNPLERGIRVDRPVTGVERLARLQRLSVVV